MIGCKKHKNITLLSRDYYILVPVFYLSIKAKALEGV